MNEAMGYDMTDAARFFAQKNAFTTGPVEVCRRLRNGAPCVVVDVREKGDFLEGHIPGAINLPEVSWPGMQGLSKGLPNILYCYSQTCHLASRAAEQFAREGYHVVEMQGGMRAWRENGFAVEKSPT